MAKKFLVQLLTVCTVAESCGTMFVCAVHAVQVSKAAGGDQGTAGPDEAAEGADAWPGECDRRPSQAAAGCHS